jgi:hypothetical protein
MNTKRLFTMTGRKTGQFLGWIIGVLVVMLLSWEVGFAGPFVPYDDFSDSPAVINKAKWAQYESVREITEGKLRLKARSSRSYTSTVSMNLTIQSPTTVNTIEADMTLHAYDNTEGARPQLILHKALYNDDTGTDYLGEVTASVIIGGPSQSPTAVLVINRKTTEDGSQLEHLSIQAFSTVPALDTPYPASITWNGSTVTGTFNGQSLTYTPETAIEDIHHPFCVLMALVDTNYANGVGKEATIEGFFDNVKKNGVVYDDFSASTIDQTKWRTYESVREIDEGKLRLEARSSTASQSIHAGIESFLSLLRPRIAKAIEAKVRLTSFDNQNSAFPVAQVAGRFFNDGSEEDGYIGDIWAGVQLGGYGTTPVAIWKVCRQTNSTDYSYCSNIALGTFTTPISIGVDYTLSVDWDGSKFILKIDDETIEYTPIVSTVLPANQPNRALEVFVREYSGGKEATIAALFDDVRIRGPIPRIQWRNPTTGENWLWYLDGVNFSSSSQLLTVPDPWQAPVSAEFNFDYLRDILWRNPTTGENYVWYMDGPNFLGSAQFQSAPAPWEIVGISGYNSDAYPDLIWHNPDTGEYWTWYMQGTSFLGSAQLFTVASPWEIVGLADFNSNGSGSDILWRNPTTGENYVWFMNGTTFLGSEQLFTVPAPWTIKGIQDFNNDGYPDLLWRNPTTGENWVWYLNGTTFIGSAQLFTVPAPWEIVGR